MLLAGLLTRAVLEGYLTAGWRGIKPAECLLLVGIGINRNGGPSAIGERKKQQQRATVMEAMMKLTTASHSVMSRSLQNLTLTDYRACRKPLGFYSQV
jgi:hypothetical protein